MDLTKVLVILITFLILITLYVIVKLNRFIRKIMREEKSQIQSENINNNIDNISKEEVKEVAETETISDIDLNNENIIKLQEINPEIDIDSARTFAERTLYSIFSTIENYNFENITRYSQLIYLKLNNIISKQKELRQIEFFQDVRIASNYLKLVEVNKGYTSLVFEVNITMKHHIQNESEIIYGSNDEVISDKYLISLAYIDNVSEMDYETKRTSIHGINCSNCGETIREFKDIKCMVCDNVNTDLIENNFIAVDYSRG